MSEGYGIRTTLAVTYDRAVEKVIAALKTEGFGVLTEIDVQATLKNKLNAESRRYVILGACNPPLAFQALTSEVEIGLLLPCNVIVYEDDQGGAVVSALNPMVALGVVDNPALLSVADQASERLRRVVASLE
jgi:uncharacterized protein (DUF302 family)